jgi:hypothetical protein
MFSPTYCLTIERRIDVPLNMELDSNVPSRLFHGYNVAIEITNIGEVIKGFSNSLILSFRMAFSISISPTDIFKASPVPS